MAEAKAPRPTVLTAPSRFIAFYSAPPPSDAVQVAKNAIFDAAPGLSDMVLHVEFIRDGDWWGLYFCVELNTDYDRILELIEPTHGKPVQVLIPKIRSLAPKLTRFQYRRDEAAELLGLSYAQFTFLIKQHQIKSSVIGGRHYFYWGELERFAREAVGKYTMTVRMNPNIRKKLAALAKQFS